MKASRVIAAVASPGRPPATAGQPGARSSSAEYHPEIDGLRAIAVLSVMFFHFQISPFSGGFVGVDTFFVISGFLITRIIVADLECGRFTFRNFYLRRVRRILPALLVTLAATFIAGVLLFDPDNLEALGESTVSAALSVSNIYFWYNVGYFDIDADLKPLLHTWSLSIEEQFYVVWPATLFVLYRYTNAGWAIFALLAFIGVGSLAASEWQLLGHPEQVFYLTPYRAYEFALGAACVWLVRFHFSSEILREILAVSGLALLAVGVFLFDETTPFPGLAALAPCLGAGLLICAGRARFTGMLLRNPLAVSIGLISYSLYLVHWPLYVFYKYWALGSVGAGDKAVLIAVSIAIAALMYRYVEQPFRRTANGKHRVRPAYLLAVCGTATALVVTPSALAAAGTGWSWRYAPELRDILVHPTSNRSNALVRERDKEPFPIPGRINALIIGDSHATDLFNTLATNDPKVYLKRAGASVQCQPVARDAQNDTLPNSRNCKGRFERILKNRKLRVDSLDFIILSPRWRSWALDRFDETIAAIRAGTSAQIIVFGPGIEFSPQVPILLARHGRIDGSQAFVNRFRDEERSELNEKLRKLSADAGVLYVDKIDVLCGGGECPIFVPGTQKLMFVDYGHLSTTGAAYFGKLLRDKRPDIADLLLN
jgi:peptidoglycan/LPS O-acetylase OafA/YrhL